MTREEILSLLGRNFFTIRWADDCIEMIDQRSLPEKEIYFTVRSVDEVIEAIKCMAIRGAPAIGIAGAMGVALAVTKGIKGGRKDIESYIWQEAKRIESSRPTAYNLKWGVRRILKRWEETKSLPLEERKKIVIAEAEEILIEDAQMCRKMGEFGASVLPDNLQPEIMTICNAGALATGGDGTALSVIRELKRKGKKISVIACETRPLLQGARLTAWELNREGIDVTLICDSAAPYTMATKKIDAVFVGADRIARNGDCANKIGTYMLAISAKAHGIPFYVVAPYSTIDPECPDGKSITIEERNPEEVRTIAGKKFAPENIRIYNPAFDVTPSELITKIITEKGVYEPSKISTCFNE